MRFRSCSPLSLATVAGAFLLTSIGISSTGAFAQEITLRLSHPLGTSTARHHGAEVFAERVSELTSGKVKVEVFPNAQLGSETQTLEGLQTGTIDLGIISVWANVVQPGRVFDLPFLFRDYDHWKAAVDGKPGQLAIDAAEGTGLEVLGFWMSGWRNIYGSQEIKTSADLSGIKIRTQQSPAFVQLFQAVGAIPTPISWTETYLALQQGTVDASETALESMFDAKQYEVAQHVSLSNHAISTAAFLVSSAKWDTLPEDVQQAIITAQKEANDAQIIKYNENDAAVIGKLEAEGVTVHEFDATEMRRIAQEEVFPQIVVEEIDKEILAEIQKL